jgi:hypothetical protein
MVSRATVSRAVVLTKRFSPCLAWAFLALCMAQPLGAQSYNVFFRATEVAGSVGGTASVSVGLQNQPEAVTGFSFGVRHDPAALEFASAAPGAAVMAALSGGAPDDRFFAVTSDVEGGVTVALILSAEDAGAVIPAGDDNEIMVLTYSVLATEAGTSSVSIAGDLGQPMVPVIVDLDGVAQLPTATDQNTTANVTFSVGPVDFVRGDANRSGRLDLLDGIVILRYISGDTNVPSSAQANIDNCLAVFNVDGSVAADDPALEDATDINITDATALFNTLFGLGAPPPAPFPECGQSEQGLAPSTNCSEFPCS